MSCSIVWGKGLAEKLARFVYNGDRLVTCGAAAGGQPNDDTTAIVSTKHFKNLRLDSGRPEIAQLVSFKPIVDSVVPLREVAAGQQHLEGAGNSQNRLADFSLTAPTLTGRQIFGGVPAEYPPFGVGLPPYQEGHGRKGRRSQ